MAAMQKVCLLLVVTSLLSVCATKQDTGPLPRPANPRESDYRPSIPFQPGPVEGVATRTVFSTDSGRGYSVDVTDIAVRPGTAVSVPFAGPAMVEVRHGGGTAIAGGRNVELRSGTILTVGEGEALTVTAQEPTTLRAYVYRAR